ncbi:Glutathione S-transferase omega-1 [Cricetulus griseus]|uniref:Glutathione-dependent dehydroascorbate reductase n=1 Tax=Cricetulus griseus TaxID=10029 RepID=G3IKN5_CRIGR|nr:Glutathione S-transferase omega-1 [Cricetulus griseus]
MSGASSRSLGKGSSPPGPVPEGLIRVYSMRFCPFAQRALMVLKAKGIRHEIVNINLKNKPEWFLKKNPTGLVPVLEDSKGRLISESVIICEYLDEAYPDKKLFPDDPYEKARQKMTLESFSKALTDCQSEFRIGDAVSMTDYLMWPWFQRLEALELNEHEIVNINLKNKPEWFLKKNPTGLVPVLEDSKGRLISESVIICEYLDEAYPDKKLFPDDPYEKARQKMTLESFSKAMTKYKKDFRVGDAVSMTDYLMWPWFQWLEALELKECVAHTPKLKGWMAAMQKDPTVSSHLIDAKTYRGFVNLYLQDSPEACDYGL